MNNVFRDSIRRLLFFCFAVTVSLMFFESICVGQGGTTGSISGTISDPNKAVVAGATVIVTNNATKEEFTAVTNDEGYFRIPSLG
ncbi:MAG TPA: carboxypeptidase-like regulatory domain-containing protein, partial [Pyrinomonadaceae bacterium]|nr:carboxypeptidase-like regulatory domain-containing protein [Pyrinomonadaceae bacterium]